MPDAPAPRTPHDAAAPSTDDLRDRALIARVERGDDAAFEQLVHLHRPRLLRIAERIIDGGRAEDAVQVALLRAYEAFRGGTVPQQPAAWLSAATRNAAIDQHRRRGPVDPVGTPDATASAPSVAAIAESRAELRRVLGDVAALPPNERDALLLRATTGAGHEAIGEQLAVSPGQARQLLHRARRRLRDVAAVLLPAWLALRVSQARAAMANVAAAPSESLLGTKGAAVMIAAAASVGGGSAALQVHRAGGERPAAAAAPLATTEAAAPQAAADGSAPTVTLGPRRVRTVASSAASERRSNDATNDSAEHGSADSAASSADQPRREASAPKRSAGSSGPTAPASSGSGDRDDDEPRRPSAGSGSSSSGASGASAASSGSSSNTSGSGSSDDSGSSGSDSGESSRDDHEGEDAPSSANAAPASAEDEPSEASSEDHSDDAEEATGRSEDGE